VANNPLATRHRRTRIVERGPSNEEECGTAPVPSLPDRPALIGSEQDQP
jgi:hypothetical protein